LRKILPQPEFESGTSLSIRGGRLRPLRHVIIFIAKLQVLMNERKHIIRQEKQFTILNRL